MGRIVLGVRVSASFQIISRLVGRLGSVVCFSVSFQSFALRMFVCPLCFCRPICRPLEGQFSVPPVQLCFRRPHNVAFSSVRVFYEPEPLLIIAHFPRYMPVECNVNAMRFKK